MLGPNPKGTITNVVRLAQDQRAREVWERTVKELEEVWMGPRGPCAKETTESSSEASPPREGKRLKPASSPSSSAKDKHMQKKLKAWWKEIIIINT